jgi:starch synthase
MVTAELQSFARTGGLGDAVEGLAKALARLGFDVAVVTPRYGVTKVPSQVHRWSRPILVPSWEGQSSLRSVGVIECRIPTSHSWGSPAADARVFLLEDIVYDRQGIYGDGYGEFGDNALRFSLLARGALAVAERLWGPVDGQGDGGPHVIHAHDWHGALGILYPRLCMGPAWRKVPSVLTIHNLAFQGVFGAHELSRLGLPWDAYRGDKLENFGTLNLLKGAVAEAHGVTTVSRRYAEEILTREFGAGLDGFLQDNASKIVGIENGVDLDAYDPANDDALSHSFSLDTFEEARAFNKKAMLAELGFSGDDGSPVFAAITRITEQKGIDTLLEILPALVERGARVVVIGQGDAALEGALRQAAHAQPDRVAVRIGFDGDLARRMYGGADFVLVPSKFEPCGLTQLYAMRYGALPVVTPVGGLADTVVPLDGTADVGHGLVARGRDAHAYFVACEEALALYRDVPALRAAQRRALGRDSSWHHPAKAYADLYARVAGKANAEA